MSALSKGFQILKAVTGDSAGLAFSEIVASTGIAKATAHRLLAELVGLSALSYDEATRRYRGGLLLASLGATVTANYDIRASVRPHLEDLHARTGNVATLGVRDGASGIYIDKIEPSDLVIRLHSEIGKSFPLHCTAMGKVLLAHSDSQTIGKLTRRKLKRYTENTITDGRALRSELEKIAVQGYAVDREEITRGLVCIAAPVYGPDGQADAAISCTISSFESTGARLQSTIRLVTECAQAASGCP